MADTCCMRCYPWQVHVAGGATCDRYVLQSVLCVADTCCKRYYVWQIRIAGGASLADTWCRRCYMLQIRVAVEVVNGRSIRVAGGATCGRCMLQAVLCVADTCCRMCYVWHIRLAGGVGVANT